MLWTLALLFILPAARPEPPKDAPRIVITAFEPFAGSKENQSQAVANRLRTLLSGVVKVDVVVLPIEYGATEKHQGLREALRKKPAPKLVLSLGESPNMKRPHFEPRADNCNTSTYPDNAQKLAPLRNNPEGPSRVELPVTKALAKFHQNPKFRPFLDPGSTIGGYVCNHTAFVLAQRLGSAKIPYGFLHVPTDGTQSADSENIAAMLAMEIAANNVAAPAPKGQSKKKCP